MINSIIFAIFYMIFGICITGLFGIVFRQIQIIKNIHVEAVKNEKRLLKNKSFIRASIYLTTLMILFCPITFIIVTILAIYYIYLNIASRV